MTIIPARLRDVVFYQGATFDETWVFAVALAEDEDPVGEDFSGWSARFTVRAAYDSTTPLLDLVEYPSGQAPVTHDGILLGADGSVRVYVRDETVAAMVHTDWTLADREDGTTAYVGIGQLELTNLVGETFRYLDGPCELSREVGYP